MPVGEPPRLDDEMRTKAIIYSSKAVSDAFNAAEVSSYDITVQHQTDAWSLDHAGLEAAKETSRSLQDAIRKETGSGD